MAAVTCLRSLSKNFVVYAPAALLFLKDTVLSHRNPSSIVSVLCSTGLYINTICKFTDCLMTFYLCYNRKDNHA